MQVEIIKITGPVSKGKWSQLEAAYKTGGKVEGRKFVSFKNKDVYDTLAQAKEGDIYDVVTSKDDAGYWQWTAIAESSGVVVAGEETQAEATGSVSTGASGSREGTSARATPTVGNTGVGRVTGSNYETAAERAVRQRLIVRQSSITAALELMKHNAPKSVLDLDAVLSIASRFEEHVFGAGPQGQVSQKNVMESLPNDLPE